MLERRDKLFARGRIPVLVGAPAASILLEAHEIVEQLFPPGDQPLPLGRARRDRLRDCASQPGAEEDDGKREAERRSSRGTALWCGSPDSVSDTGWSAATLPPTPAMYTSPCAVMSCWVVSCGDDSFMSPTFLAITENSLNAAGNRCATSTVSLSDGNSQPTWTTVLPGGNGPWTVTRVPLALASGDEP